MLQSQLGGSGHRRSLLAFSTGAIDLLVNTGSAGLTVCRGEGQHRPQESWEMGEKSSWPVRVAEQRTGGQHGVGKHPCGGSTFLISVNRIRWVFLMIQGPHLCWKAESSYSGNRWRRTLHKAVSHQRRASNRRWDPGTDHLHVPPAGSLTPPGESVWKMRSGSAKSQQMDKYVQKETLMPTWTDQTASGSPSMTSSIPPPNQHPASWFQQGSIQ